jgi:hypothetical protein
MKEMQQQEKKEQSQLQSKGWHRCRETIRRYTCNIGEFHSKLEEETQLGCESSQDKLESISVELETKW